MQMNQVVPGIFGLQKVLFHLKMCPDISASACGDTYSEIANKHVVGGKSQPGVETVAECKALCSSMSEPECVGFDFDTNEDAWKGVRCWIHEHQIKDLEGVDHYDRESNGDICK